MTLILHLSAITALKYLRGNIQKSISSPIMNTEKQQSRKQYQTSFHNILLINVV